MVAKIGQGPVVGNTGNVGGDTKTSGAAFDAVLKGKTAQKEGVEAKKGLDQVTRGEARTSPNEVRNATQLVRNALAQNPIYRSLPTQVQARMEKDMIAYAMQDPTLSRGRVS